ncbi:MAG: putative DNA-binding domain-containing protein [Myxococcales bacterium]|nr:putative DNA-binding domain-containing protein [Myxococcales bacterium]
MPDDEIPPALPLSALQRRLFGLITARGTVAEALDAAPYPPRYLTDHVVGDERLDAIGRLDIYNGMYFFRLLEDVLQADYPAVRAWLGDEGFTVAAAAYIEAHPPCAPSARDASARFPEFLRTFSAAPPGLADLAALEWARVDVFDEADDDALTRAHVAAAASEDLTALALLAVRAHRLVDAAYPVHEAWRALESAHVAPGPAPHVALAPQDTALLVWREGRTIYHRPLPAPEASAFALVAAGTTFGALCERLGETSDEEDAARQVVAFLSRWVDDGLLRAPGLRPAGP